VAKIDHAIAFTSDDMRSSNCSAGRKTPPTTYAALAIRN